MNRQNSGALVELPITLDRTADTALPVQLAAALREAVDGHILLPAEKLPATRLLAARLGVARGVVVAAYEQLAAEGYVLAGQGVGTVVHPRIAEGLGRVQRSSQVQEAGAAGAAGAVAVADTGSAAASLPLAVGAPDTTAVNTPQWRAAWRKAAVHAHVGAPVLGDPQLRQEIVEHLRRMRGTRRHADDIIVTAGARDGLNLILTALNSARGRQLVVGVEDPGFPSLRNVASRHSAAIVPLSVDAYGFETDALPGGGIDAVIVTPSHQYPLGGSLPLSRRRELLAWASRTDAVIIEDDYDSELRYVGAPLPALAALDDSATGQVALLGTFSKTVSPALSAGFIVASARLRELIEPVRSDLSAPVSAVVQRALAEYLASGELRRHTARMRRRYGRRREQVMRHLAGLPGVRVRPMSGGLHAVIEFDNRDESAMRARLAHLGVVALSSYWQRRGNAPSERFGLVIGMGGASAEEFELALSEVRDTLSANLPVVGA